MAGWRRQGLEFEKSVSSALFLEIAVWIGVDPEVGRYSVVSP